MGGPFHGNTRQQPDAPDGQSPAYGSAFSPKTCSRLPHTTYEALQTAYHAVRLPLRLELALLDRLEVGIPDSA